jgi:hypothetical protein
MPADMFHRGATIETPDALVIGRARREIGRNLPGNSDDTSIIANPVEFAAVAEPDVPGAVAHHHAPGPLLAHGLVQTCRHAEGAAGEFIQPAFRGKPDIAFSIDQRRRRSRRLRRGHRQPWLTGIDRLEAMPAKALEAICRAQAPQITMSIEQHAGQ